MSPNDWRDCRKVSGAIPLGNQPLMVQGKEFRPGMDRGVRHVLLVLTNDCVNLLHTGYFPHGIGCPTFATVGQVARRVKS